MRAVQLRVPEDSDSFAHLVKNMRKRTDPDRLKKARKAFTLEPAPTLKDLRQKLEKAKTSVSEVLLSNNVIHRNTIANYHRRTIL